MKSLTSKDNPQYKELKQLASSASARRKSGYSILDGIHLCQSYLEHIGSPVLCAISETSLYHPEVVTVVAECESRNIKCLMLTDSLFHPLSQVENGIDIIFLISTPVNETYPQLMENAVLLDRVQDPGNLGSILRSAAAAGIKQVYCSPGTAAAWSPRVLRAGMGAHFLLKIYEDVSLMDLIGSSKIPVIATTPYTEKSIYDFDLASPVGWLLGHEGQGVDEKLLAIASEQLVIPHLGAMESLNVAASAAVCFFEQVRQRRKSF